MTDFADFVLLVGAVGSGGAVISTSESLSEVLSELEDTSLEAFAFILELGAFVLGFFIEATRGFIEGTPIGVYRTLRPSGCSRMGLGMGT